MLNPMEHNQYPKVISRIVDRFLTGLRYLFCKTSSPALGPTQLPFQWVMGDISPEVKRLRFVAYHSPPSNAEVELTWSHTSAYSYAFIASTGISTFRCLFIVTVGSVDWS